MRLIARLFAAFAVIALLVAPAAAQTRVETLPQIASFQKARFDFALTVTGQIFAYGKGEIDGPNRLHLTLKTVPFDDLPETTVEAILYDGVFYIRENDDPQWYIESVTTVPLPEETLPSDAAPSGVISLLGAADVAGVPTNHYQVWTSFDDGSVSTLDAFIGQRTPWMHKLQVSAYLSSSDSISLLGLDYRFYDFEAEEITVYAPSGAMTRMASAAANSPSQHLKVSLLQLRDLLRWSAR